MRPTKNGAWLIRNSWGTNFGDKGYMWISYEEPTLQKAVACNFESVDNYDNIYLHDGVGPNQQYAYLSSSGVKEVSIANKFCSKSNETLKAVSFWTSNYNIGYTINIYSSTSSPTEVSTKLLSSCSGNTINMGYHTIDLSSPVSLNSGDWFTVMVKLKVNNSDSSVRFQLEGNNRTDKFGNYEITCTQGESFINFNDGEGWYDAKYVTFWGDCFNNACIRAFTVDRGASPTPTLTITPSTLSLNTTTNKTATVNVHTTGGNYVTSSMSQEGIIDCDIGRWEGDDFNVTVAALKAGTCTYTLNLYEDSSKAVLYDTKTIAVTVSSGSSSPYLSLSANSIVLDMTNNKKAQIQISVINPTNGLPLTGTVSDYTVVDWDFGDWSSNATLPVYITAKNGGTCTITFKLYKDSSKQSVYDTKVLNITVKGGKIDAYARMVYRESKKIDIKDFDEVSYSSLNTSIVRVNSNGIVTAVGRGVGIIEVTDSDSRVCRLHVTVDYEWWQWLIKILLFGWIWY